MARAAKKAARRRQINIRDDEIYSRAHRLAQRLNVPMKEVVRSALMDYEKKADAAPNRDTDTELWLAELDLITKRIAATAIHRTHEEDDAELYDENGLPR